MFGLDVVSRIAMPIIEPCDQVILERCRIIFKRSHFFTKISFFSDSSVNVLVGHQAAEAVGHVCPSAELFRSALDGHP